MIAETMRVEHLKAVIADIRPEQWRSRTTDCDLVASNSFMAWAVLDGGAPVACIGLIKIWTGRHNCWAFLSNKATRKMVTLTRMVRRGMLMLPRGRYEIAVDSEFDAGIRWAFGLGFSIECVAKRYLPDGGDAVLFAKVI